MEQRSDSIVRTMMRHLSDFMMSRLNVRARVWSLTDYVALRRGKSQISKQEQHLLPGYAQIQEKPVIQLKWLSD